MATAIETPRENLNIKAVSHLSGLSEHTIRAWERRYAAVKPARTDTGHRTYSMDDVERLKLLGVLVNQGHTIRMVANLPMTELKSLLTEHTHALIENPNQAHGVAPGAQTTVMAPLPQIDALVEALLRFELSTLGRLLSKARIQFDIRSFVFGICVPLMRAVGREVEDRRISIAQEHALSALLGDHLGQILQVLNDGNSEKPAARRIAVASPAGDIHEFGILLGAILAASQDWSVQYLGPNLPAADLAQTVNRLNCPVLLIGTADVPESELKQPWRTYFAELDRLLHPASNLWIGGAVASPKNRVAITTQRPPRFIETLEQLDTVLAGNASPVISPENNKDSPSRAS
jgi:DNA-binding transcriptional MerR regulator